MKPYVIRPAQPPDLEVILRHRRRMFEDMGYGEPAAVEQMLSTSRPLIERGLTTGSYRGWMVEHPADGIVAGGGLISLEFQSHPRDPEPRRTWVVNMYTEPAHRRQGLARALMQEIVAWCRASGLRSVSLHASDDARALYESLGFEPTNEMRLSL
jgi:GNAT superfamily N-acetyltransferase